MRLLYNNYEYQVTIVLLSSKLCSFDELTKLPFAPDDEEQHHMQAFYDRLQDIARDLIFLNNQDFTTGSSAHSSLATLKETGRLERSIEVSRSYTCIWSSRQMGRHIYS